MSRDRLLDHVLVLRCQVGDEDAFSALFQRFGVRTERYLRGLVGDSDAEDVQQMVWIAVFEHIGGLANPGGFTTWLFQLARRKAIDTLRRRRRRLDGVAALERQSPHAPSGRLTDPEVRIDVRDSIEALSPIHRDVVILRYWEGLTYPEIAMVVGCPVGTVRSRLHHASAALRASLQPSSAEGGPGNEKPRGGNDGP